MREPVDYTGPMHFAFTRLYATGAVLVLALLAADPAHAFRCKNKIVREDMHEQQVIAACGQPTTRRNLGLAVRGYTWRGNGSSRRYYGYGNLVEEVLVTEYVYNFGPRKLMRRLIFEGGVLVRIESIGYGYIEK
jgi:hypothetical protein